MLFSHPLSRRDVPPYKALRSRNKHFHSLHLKGKYELKLYQNSSVFTIRYLDELKQHLEREKWFPRGEVRAGRAGAGARARGARPRAPPHAARGPGRPKMASFKTGWTGDCPSRIKLFYLPIERGRGGGGGGGARGGPFVRGLAGA